MTGFCKCGGKVDGIIRNDASSERVEIICTITKGDGKCGKRFLRGWKRHQTVKEMASKTVHVYRAEQASEKMDEGDPEPPNLASSPVLRLARHQYNQQQLLHSDPVKALQMLKHADGAYIIRNIGLDPFYVHYWSRHQLSIYRDYVGKESSCLCIDATGSIIRRIKHGELKSKTIYLYHGVIGLNEGQFPVIQMISESQNANTIHYWLMEWVRSGAPFPKEVVIDGGRAILTGVVRAFTKFYTLNDYADACYNYANLPSCYIRMDNAHFMNTYVKVLKDVPRRVATFYKAAMGQLIICRNVETAKNIIKSLLLISQSETDGYLNDGLETEVEKSRKFLLTLITDEEVSTIFLTDGKFQFK